MWRALLLLLWLWPAWGFAQTNPEPLLRVQLEATSAVPGQAILLDITLLVPTWLPEPPEFPSFEARNLIVRRPEGSSGPTSERIGDETWSGILRTYHLHPMVVGSFRIPPQPVKVTYAHPDTLKPVNIELETPELVFEGSAPEGAEGLDPFVAAESLSLEQQVEGDPGELEPGDALTRVVTARVRGASPIFLPPLIPSFEAAGFADYPKEPRIRELSDAEGVKGERSERVTYVAEAGGRAQLAPIRLRWWNLRRERIETAELPGLELISRGPPPSAPQALSGSRFARWMVGATLLLALGFLLARRLWPTLASRRRARREARLASEAFAFDQLISALRAQDFGATQRSLALWTGRLPDPGEADRKRIDDALQPLGQALYGRSAGAAPRAEWTQAQRSLRAARQLCLSSARARNDPSVLPALNPR